MDSLQGVQCSYNHNRIIWSSVAMGAYILGGKLLLEACRFTIVPRVQQMHVQNGVETT